MRRIIRLLWLFILFFSGACFAGQSWSRLYTERFSTQQALSKAREEHLVFEKASVPQFSQLVFSWNAFRPALGHFTFHARIRNARTKTWSPWCKMIDWGADGQKSYVNTTFQKARYIYVRLEADQKDLADGFRVKVVPNAGSSLRDIRGLAVCTADFTQFRPEPISDQLLALPSVHVRNVPKKSQFVLDHPRAQHLCSPTCWSMLTSFLMRKDVDPTKFAEHVFDVSLDTYGSWQFNVAHAFERCGGKIFFATARLPSFVQLHQQLRRGMPVVVSVRGFLDGAPKRYDNGHLLVVVGWDAEKQQVICHDPALETDKKTVKRYHLKGFLSAWERSRRLAYLAEPNRIG